MPHRYYLMRIKYLLFLPLLFLVLGVSSCSRPASDLIHGEYRWTQCSEDGTVDRIVIRPDGTFNQYDSLEHQGNWTEIKDLGNHSLFTVQAGNDWDPTLLLFTYPNGRKQYVMLSTPFTEYGNCRKTFRLRELTPIDTVNNRIVKKRLPNFFAKPVDVKKSNFKGCPEADISRNYKYSLDNDSEQVETAEIDIEYHSNSDGKWKYSGEWNTAFKEGIIRRDSLYDSITETECIGFLSIDTVCCEHKVYFRVGDSVALFR